MAGRRDAERMRAFNRFYTEAIGSLDDRHEGVDLTLAQSRMLHATRALGSPEVGEIAERLRLDLAFTSRSLGALEERGLLTRAVSPRDRRCRVVELTDSGRAMLADLEGRSNARMLGLVDHLDRPEVDELLRAMDAITTLLGRRTTAPPTTEPGTTERRTDEP